MSKSGHERKIRGKINAGLNADIRIVTDWGRVDNLETSKDPSSLSQGFKCHRGSVEAHFFFRRENKPGFIEKMVHITKKYINDDMCYLWLYNLKAHDFREYIIDSTGTIYNNSGKIINLPFFTAKEWRWIALSLIDYLKRHETDMVDMGHVSPTNKRYVKGMEPVLRSPARIMPTASAQHSLVRQMQTNRDNSNKSVIEDVLHNESYWVHHSRKEEPHNHFDNPMIIRKPLPADLSKESREKADSTIKSVLEERKAAAV